MKSNKTILITGGAGFIGSNFVSFFLEKYSEYNLVVLDKLTYAGTLDNLNQVLNNYRFNFVKGDICDRNLVEDLFSKYQFKGVIHFAAESHVDNSIESPECFIKTNINGTFTLLDVAKNSWMLSPFNVKPEFSDARFHHISTDEVFGSLGNDGKFNEVTPYAPNSPYSASKASSDMLVRSYFHTYGLNVVTTNCSNNYGKNQHSEKLIPTVIRKALAEEPIPIYGNGKNVRDWLFVEDHCCAIDVVFHNGKSGEIYCVGGNNEISNIDLAQQICKILDELKPRKSNESYSNLLTFVKDRAGHDLRYAVDISKIKNELNWTPNEEFKTGILKTIKNNIFD